VPDDRVPCQRGWDSSRRRRVAALAVALVVLTTEPARHPVAACESPRNLPIVSSLIRARAAATASCILPDICRDADPTAVGEWRTLAGTTGVLAVHAALLRTGRVLFLAGSGNDHNYRSGIDAARLFDPESETVLGAPEFVGANVPANDPPTLNASSSLTP
jgi:hypothetical protein